MAAPVAWATPVDDEQDLEPQLGRVQAGAAVGGVLLDVDGEQLVEVVVQTRGSTPLIAPQIDWATLSWPALAQSRKPQRRVPSLSRSNQQLSMLAFQWAKATKSGSSRNLFVMVSRAATTSGRSRR